MFKYEPVKITHSRIICGCFAVFSLLSFIITFYISKPPVVQDAAVTAYSEYLADSDSVDHYYLELKQYAIDHIKDETVDFPYTYDPNRVCNDYVVLDAVYDRISYLTGHTDKMNGLAAAAARRADDLRAYGYTDASYEIKAQEALGGCYTALENTLSSDSGYAVGYDSYLTNPVLPFLILLLVTAGTVYIFRSDFSCGVYPVMRTCHKEHIL